MAIDDDFIVTLERKRPRFKSIMNSKKNIQDIRFILENQNQFFMFKTDEVISTAHFGIKFENISLSVNVLEELTEESECLSQIRYQKIYEGIDAIFYVKNGLLEQDYIVAPAIDPSVICFSVREAEHISIDDNGNLNLLKHHKRYKLLKPISYQLINGEKKMVESAYRINDDQTVGFELAAYDATYPLIIDPIFDFSEHLKHDYVVETEKGEDVVYNKLNNGSAITKDKDGNIYVLTTETTYVEGNWALDPPIKDTTFTGFLVVRKYNELGEQLGQDMVVAKNLAKSVTLAAIGTDIEVDGEGNIYIIGSIMDPIKVIISIFQQMPVIGPIIALILIAAIYGLGYDKPTNTVIKPTAGAYLQEVTGMITSFILKFPQNYQLDDEGNIILSACTYIGGERIVLSDEEWAVIMEAFLKGDLEPLQDAFAKIMMKMTFVNKVRVDKSGFAWVVGSTNSDRIPASTNTLHGHRHDAFVMKLNQDFSQVKACYYIGGELSDFGFGLVLHETSDAYEVFVVGEAEVDVDLTQQNIVATRGKFNTLNAIQPNPRPNAVSSGFIAKFSSIGIPDYITLFSGNRGETLLNDVVNYENSLYVMGSTEGGTPIMQNSFQPTHLISPSQYVGFISKINAADQTVLASTYLGGSKDYIGASSPLGLSFLPYIGFSAGTINTGNQAVLKSITVDENGFVYVTGESASVDFPMTPQAYQPVLLGRSDSILAKLDQDLSHLIYATYFGGSNRDVGNQMVVDESGNMFVIGQTASRDFPVSTGEFPSEASESAVFYKIPSMQTNTMIAIPDSNLKKALNLMMHREITHDITEDELFRLPRILRLDQRQIADITGLEYAKYLRGLYLQENNIEDISLLSVLKTVKFIDTSKNKISDISVLNNIPDGYFAGQQIEISLQSNVGVAQLDLSFLKDLSGSIPLIRDISDGGSYDLGTHLITWNQVVVGQVLTFNFGNPVDIRFSYGETFNGTVAATIV